jgi:hypothetical protein
MCAISLNLRFIQTCPYFLSRYFRFSNAQSTLFSILSPSFSRFPSFYSSQLKLKDNDKETQKFVASVERKILTEKREGNFV